MNFRQFIRILIDHGFELDRHGSTSHRVYKGIVNGKTHLVTVACHREGADIKPGTLGAMIRQSGLPKKLFK